MPTIGENFLRYKIISLIGSGGMGEVYLARDLRLERNVAVKVLRPKLSHRHGDGLERFMLEARSASALNHPNIITIYEIGEAEGSHYIASEFIEGKTLHEKMARNSLSLPEILNIAIQTAEALTAAHAAGIVHRDIKPENIMIRDDGYVKVLDFGLAKLTEYEMQLADVEADTRRMVATNPGVIMGTVSYMSPEQARGRPVDKRTDIWSLGVVIYEMVTGERPFTGETTSDVIAAILRSDPDPVSMHIPDAPKELERIISKTLRKDREDRYQHIKDLLIDLKDLRRELDVRMHSETATFGLTNSGAAAQSTGEPSFSAESTSPAGAKTNSVSEMFRNQFRLHPVMITAIVAVAVLALAAGAFGVKKLIEWGNSTGFESMRFAKLTSIGSVEGGQIAISPDGKYFSYVERDPGGQSLWVRQTATSSGVQLIPAGGMTYGGLSFSLDGSYIYYCAAEQNASPAIYKIPALGGEKRKIVNDADGPITFSPRGDRFAFVRGESQLVLANEDGSSQQTLATTEEGNAWWLPAWSPDGEKLVSGVYTRKDNNIHIVEVSVRSGAQAELPVRPWLRISGLVWLPDESGILISGRDPDTQISQIWKLSYPAGRVSRVTNDLSSYEGLSLTADGNSVVSVQGNRLANIWVADEANPAAARKVTVETNRDEGLSGIAWTPDGKIVYTTRVGAGQDLWTVDRDGSNNRQITFNSKSNFSPAISPDGRYIVFVSTRLGDPNIWRVDRDGGNPVQLTNDPGIEGQPVTSADGKWVIYQLEDGNNKTTIWKVAITGGPPTQLTNMESTRPTVSPDGKAIVFRVGPAATGGSAKIGLLSLDGAGTQELGLPAVATARIFRWSSDGRSLIYVDNSTGVSRLWSQALADGQPKPIAEFKDKRIYGVDISAFGSGIALSLGSETSEALMISNFK